MLYSGLIRGFIDTAFYVGEIPADAVQISIEYRDELLAGERAGKIISPDVQGMPVLLDHPQESIESALIRAKNELRALRIQMLDAATGIGFRASVAGNTALAQEAAQVSQRLLDITDDPDLNAAQTYDDMRAAGMAAYRRIASGASAELASVFKEITGV